MRVLCIGGPADGIVHESHNPMHVMPYIEPNEVALYHPGDEIPRMTTIKMHHYQLRRIAQGRDHYGWAYQHDCVNDCGYPPGELDENNIKRAFNP